MVQVEDSRLAELLRKEWELDTLKNRGGALFWEAYNKIMYPQYGNWDDRTTPEMLENIDDKTIIKID